MVMVDFIFSSPVLNYISSDASKKDNDYIIELPSSGYIDKGYTGK